MRLWKRRGDGCTAAPRVLLRRAVSLRRQLRVPQQLRLRVTQCGRYDQRMASEMSPQVVAQLVESHARFLEFVERRVGSRAAAEDILQEAFTRALSRGDTLRSSESAKAWFYRLLRNALIDHYRRRGAERRALETAADEPEPTSRPADEALMGTVCACMNLLIDTLKPEYAEALRRVDLEDQSLADYAQQHGITSNNAGVRLHRAREALHKQLVTSCGTCATHGCLDCHCQKH